MQFPSQISTKRRQLLKVINGTVPSANILSLSTGINMFGCTEPHAWQYKQLVNAFGEPSCSIYERTIIGTQTRADTQLKGPLEAGSTATRPRPRSLRGRPTGCYIVCRPANLHTSCAAKTYDTHAAPAFFRPSLSRAELAVSAMPPPRCASLQLGRKRSHAPAAGSSHQA